MEAEGVKRASGAGSKMAVYRGRAGREMATATASQRSRHEMAAATGQRSRHEMAAAAHG